MNNTDDMWRYEDPGIDLNNFSKEEEIAKFEGNKAAGWTIYVRLYTEPPKTAKGLYIPASAHEDQQYRSCVGLVVSMGEECYTDKNRYTRPWCKLGDWVLIPRHSGYKTKYKGMPVWVVKEDAIDGVLDDPRYITK